MVKLDEAKLRTLLSEYLVSDSEMENYQLRVRNYCIARQLLDQIASDETDSRSSFADKFSRLVAGSGQEGAWHSGGLFRHKGELTAQWKAVQSIVRYVKGHPNTTRGELFGQVREMAKKVSGLGVNIPTEIMHTYYPDKYAVLNQNSYKSLLELAIARKYPEPLSFHAEDYNNFVSDLIYLKELCGLESLGQADHFLNYIYWKVVKAKSYVP